MKNIKPSVSNILEKLKGSARTMNPEEAEKELKALEAQRPIIFSALWDAIFRKRGVSKRHFENEPDSPSITIDFLADIIIELVYGGRIKKRSSEFEVENLIKDVHQEIEKVYNALKKRGFSGRINTKQEDYRKAALKHFDENQKNIKFLMREYLEDFSLYSFIPGQETRFKGKLLQKIVVDHGSGEFSERALITLFRKTDQKQ